MNFINDGWLRQAQNYDKLSHAGGSCLVVCLLWYVAMLPEGYFFPINRKIQREIRLLVCGLVIVGGIALEAWQGFNGVGFSWRDVVADVVGVVIAYGAIGG